MSKRCTLITAVVLVMVIAIAIAAYYIVKREKTNYLVDVYSKAPLGVYRKFVISTDASECAPLAKDILLKGGTAIDSAITTLLCMAIVLPHSLGLGGGSFMTYYDASEKKGTIFDGREQASKNSVNLKFNKTNLQDGPFSVAIPGELAVYWRAYQSQKEQKVSWKELFEGPIKLAREGAKVNPHLARNIQINQNRLQDRLRKILKKENSDKWLEVGDVMKRPDLAATYEQLANAEDPIKLFYDGAMTEKFVEELAGSGITRQDFKDYDVQVRDAIVFDLDEENRLLAPTLPSSGVILGFIMKVIAELKDTFIKPGMEYSLKDSAWFHHQITEILKHAYSRRAAVADEIFEPKITAELLRNFTNFDKSDTDSYFNRALKMVRESDHTHEQEYYGGREYFMPDNGTAHMSIIDQYGNAISVTSTINIYFGSGILSETGIIFNDENDDFSIKNVTNYFGLPTSRANLIEPKKRPASSMCPIIVTNRTTGEVKLSMGGAGGSLIISGMAQALTRILYMNEDIKVAIDQWRFHDQLYPNEFQYEQGFNKELLKVINSTYKHTILPIPNRRCIISAVSKSNGKLYAKTDYRKGGSIDGV